MTTADLATKRTAVRTKFDEVQKELQAAVKRREELINEIEGINGGINSLHAQMISWQTALATLEAVDDEVDSSNPQSSPLADLNAILGIKDKTEGKKAAKRKR